MDFSIKNEDSKTYVAELWEWNVCKCMAENLACVRHRIDGNCCYCLVLGH